MEFRGKRDYNRNIARPPILALFAGTICLLGSSCATVSQPEVVDSPSARVISPTLQQQPKYLLKRKVVIARFTNETMYGKSVLLGDRNNLVERGASDILHARLAEAQKFLLFERYDSDKLIKALEARELHTMGLPADYLIIGSVTEFGRDMTGKTGFFTQTKQQRAYAKVVVRLVDARSSLVLFATEGSGEAISEVGTTFGVGTHAGYDTSLNDKAISAAISKLVSNLVENLLETPWRSYLLSIEAVGGEQYVTIGGGAAQGLGIGQMLAVIQRGKQVVNPQTGIPIELEGTKIATIQVVSLFGTTAEMQGSKCVLVSGTLPQGDLANYVVEEEQP